jgi:RNase P protein component
MSPVLMGVAVGKRVGNAVARSRVRRRLRESMRHHVRSIADAVPEERTLTCVLLIRGNKVTVGRVRADADQACVALIRRIGETIDRKDSTAV